MVLDTSALVAIFLGEPERDAFVQHVLQAETKLLSAANALETGIVLEAKRGEAAGREFDLFLVRAQLEVVPVDAEQVEIARSAWRRYIFPSLPTMRFENLRLEAMASTTISAASL